MTATGTVLRIGEVARTVGTTPRTIRYYEEIGLLEPAGDRRAGGHRVYDEADVERLREIVRIRDVLGVSLEELKELVEASEARAALRAEWERAPGRGRRSSILVEALGHIDRQLTLVRRRRAELDRLEQGLAAKRRRLRARLKAIESGGDGE